VVTPAARREATTYLRQSFEMSERRACRVIGTDRTSVRYRGVRPDDVALRERLKALAQERRRFGYRRLHVLLRREGHAVNRKRVQRLYREERLTVRRRGGRKRALATRRPMVTPQAPDQRWSLDFVSDQLTDGRRFRILAVVDDCTRECLALVADTSISGRRVARELDDIIRRRGRRPDTIVSDNGTELTSNAILSWADETGVGWHYIAPGKPQQKHRELQWSAARRTAQRDAVPLAAARPRRARGLAARLQQRAAALQTRLDDASGLRQRPQRRSRPGRCASLGLRAPASCHPSNRRLKSTPDSRLNWMKNGGHVRTSTLCTGHFRS
jgi:transposase InsO family protein